MGGHRPALVRARSRCVRIGSCTGLFCAISSFVFLSRAARIHIHRHTHARKPIINGNSDGNSSSLDGAEVAGFQREFHSEGSNFGRKTSLSRPQPQAEISIMENERGRGPQKSPCHLPPTNPSIPPRGNTVALEARAFRYAINAHYLYRRLMRARIIDRYLTYFAM